MKEKKPTYRELGKKLAVAEKTIADLNEELAVTKEKSETASVRGREEKKVYSESEQNLRNLLDASSLGIAIFTTNEEVIYANRALLDFCGFKTVEEFNAESIQRFYTPESYRLYQERNEKQRSGQPVPAEYEASVKRADGEIFNVRVIFNEVVWGGQHKMMATYLDITECTKAEEQVKRSEARFHEFFEKQNNYCYIVSADGNIMDVNSRAVEALGYTKDEIIGKPLLTMIYAPESRNYARQLFDKWLKVGELENEELTILTKSGEKRIVLLNVSSVRDTEGKLLHSISIQTDITERKKAEEALKKSEEKFAKVFRSTPDFIVVSTLEDGVVTDVNDAFVRRSGYSYEEIIGHSSTELNFWGEEDRDKMVQILKEKGRVRNEIFQFHNRSGEAVFVDFSAEPIEIGGKKCLISVLMEITERVKTEESLRRQAQIMEQVQDIVVTTDMTGRVLSWNGGAANIFGYSAAEALNKHISFLATPDKYGKLSKHQEISPGLEKGAHVSDVDVLTKSGEKKIIRLSLSPIKDKQGTIVMMCGYGIDVTERRRAERALAESEFVFSSIFHNSPSILAITTLKEGQIIEVNDVYCRLTGYNREELIGHTTTGLKLWTNIEQRDEVIRKVRNNEQVRDLEVEIRVKSGDVRTVVLSASLISLKNEPCLITSAIDVTGRKQTERALFESEQKIRSVFSVAPIGIGVVVDRVLMEVNQRFCDMLGYSREEIIGRDGSMIYASEEEYKRVGVKKYAQIAERGTGSIETRLKRKDGEIIDVLMSSTPIVPSDLSQGVTFTALDITERKKMENAVKESEEKFAKAFRSSPEPIIITDIESGVVIDTNEAVLRATGFSYDEMIGRTVLELNLWVRPEERKDMQRILKEKGRINSVRIQFRMKSGELRTFNYSIEPIEISGKKCMITVLSDITEREKVEQALKESEQKLRSIFSIAPVGIGVLVGNVVTEVNQKYCDILGYSRDEVSNRDGRGIYLVEDEYERVCKERDSQISSRGTAIIDTKFRRKDGSIIDVILGFQPVVPADLSQGLVFSCMDITERKRMENELRESEEKFAKAFRSSPEAVTITTLDADAIILETNETACKNTGYSYDELIGHGIYELGFWADPEDGKRMRRLLEEQGRVHTELYKFRVKSGEIRTWEFSAEPIEIGGKKCIISVQSDITERIKAEEALKESEERFRNLFETMAQGVVYQEADGKISLANPAAEQILGLTLEQMQGRTSADKRWKAIHEDGTEFAGERHPAMIALSTGKPVRNVVMGVFNPVDDDYRWIIIDAIPEFKKDEKKPYRVYTKFRDITVSRQLEEKIRYQADLIQTVPDAIVSSDLDYKLISWNRAAEELYGWREEEVIGKYIFDVLKAELGTSLEDVQASIDEKGYWQGESVHYTRDGRKLYILDSVSMKRDAYGNNVGAVSVFKNITESKKMEDALVNEATRRRILVEQSSDGIVFLDQDGKVNEANQRFAQMLGYSDEELQNLHVWDWDTQWTKEHLLEMINTVDEAGDHFETCHRRKDGTTFDVEISSNGATFAGQKLVFCVCRDITERKKMEQALRESEEKFSRAFHNSPDDVLITTVEDGTIIEVNDSCIRRSGYSREDFIGHSLVNMPGGWMNLGGRNHYVSMLRKNGHVVDIEGKFRSKSGVIRTVLINGELIQLGGKQYILNTGRDITERRQMEESIRYHASLVENVSDAITSSDMNYKVLSWNKAAEKMYGWTEKEAIGKSVMEVTKPIFINTDEDEILQTLRKGGSWKGEAIHHGKDGKPIDVLISISLLRDEQGKEKGAVTIFTDITERKQAEEKHQTILETALDGFHILDMDGNVLEVNDSYCRMTGYARDELLKMNIGDLVVSKEPGHRENIEELPEKGYDRFETQHICKDGRIIDLEVTINYLNIGDGQVFSFLHDITKRKQNEERINFLNMTLRSIRNVNQLITGEKDRNKLIQNVCDTLVEGRSLINCWIALFDNSRNLLAHAVADTGGAFDPMFDLLKQGKFPQCVEKALRRNKPVVTRIHDKSCQECPLAPRTAEFGSITIKLYYGDKTFGILNVSIPSSIASDKDEIELYQEVANDIAFALYNIELEAEHEVMEQERLRAAKLESIGTLAGGIAHDFNNLLTGILGNIGMAKLNVKPADAAYELLDEAEKATVRTRDLTQQLLTFARGGKPVKKLININTLLKETATFALRGSQLKLKLSLPQKLWKIKADEGQISQVIQNLVINAEEAMPKGGILSIEAANTVIGKVKRLPIKVGNYVVINVKDTGVGMSKEQLQKVFEPYYTTKKRGSGLGLTSAFSIVRNHNGYLYAESTAGKGSTFYVYLPASKKITKGGKKMTAETKGKAGGRILVMDDEPIIQRMLNQMLTLLGYEVVITPDGAAAVDRYLEAFNAGNPFDVVIMDLTIPGGMGGKEAVKKLLEKDPSAKVIVSSGYATDPIMSEYKKYGFSAVVAKPYTVSQLEEALRDLVKKKKK